MSDLTNNLKKYESSEVVEIYSTRDELQPAEKYLFSRYLVNGLDILDMGVGGGRTTRHLAALAGRYVGADYSRAMVEVCRSRFPGLEFRHCDATHLDQFLDGSFDAMIFSFNGIDYITNDAGRTACLAETARILRPGGIFIFSSHNARILAIPPQLAGCPIHKAPWRIARAIGMSVRHCWRALNSAVYRAGEGYVRDHVHGGMDTYFSTPTTMSPQLARAGFEVVERVAGPNHAIRSPALTAWHYYACRKRSQDAS